MRIAKGKPNRTRVEPDKRTAEMTAPDAASAHKTSQAARVDVVEEVAGKASAAKLQKILERLLGGGDDSDVKALVLKLSKADADTSDTSVVYTHPDE